MNLISIVLVIATLVPSLANAQITKCKGPDGKIIYSDTLCLGNDTQKDVYVPQGGNGAGLDNGEIRAKADTMRLEADIAAASRNVPPECRNFRYHVGDSTGQELAALAKKECIAANVGNKNGIKVATTDRDNWRTYFADTDARKQRAVDRALQNQQLNRSYNCTPNRFGGGVTCQ